MKFFILDDDVDFLNYVKDKITFFYKNALFKKNVTN